MVFINSGWYIKRIVHRNELYIYINHLYLPNYLSAHYDDCRCKSRGCGRFNEKLAVKLDYLETLLDKVIGKPWDISCHMRLCALLVYPHFRVLDQDENFQILLERALTLAMSLAKKARILSCHSAYSSSLNCSIFVHSRRLNSIERSKLLYSSY